MAKMNLAGVALVASLTAACGGGGGGDGAAPPTTGTPPSNTTLNAQEQLAYQSWAVRTLTTRWVIDNDGNTYAGFALPTQEKRRFAGLYPVGAGASGAANFPSGAFSALTCKNGGTKKVTSINPNNTPSLDAGESVTETFAACKDGDIAVDGTLREDYRGTLMVYPSPNDKSVRSASFVLSLDLAYKKLLEQTTYSGSVKGALDTNITQLSRIYKLVNMAYTYDGGGMVGNTTVTISRSDNFGFDQPFSVLSITGSVQIDGVPFTITSTAIPWRTSSANGVPYFPLSGLVTATGPNGEKIVTQFGATGASCSITPAGATAPSVRVDNCSLV